MADKKTRKARVLVLIAAFSVAECLYLISSGRSSHSIAFYILLSLFEIFLGVNWTWGYNRLFVEGVWFYREKKATLTDDAERKFMLLYGIHLLFDLIISVWLLLHQQYIIMAFSVPKALLIVYAYHAMFRSASY